MRVVGNGMWMGLGLVAALWAPQANAATYETGLQVTGEVRITPIPGQDEQPLEPFDHYAFDAGAAGASVTGDWSMHALWSGSGTASAGPGTLRFGLVNSVENGLPDRSVQSVGMSGYAELRDTMQVAANGTLSTIEYTFRLDGSQTGPGTYVTLVGWDRRTGAGRSIDFASPGVTDLDFTFGVSVVDGLADFAVALIGRIDHFGSQSAHSVIDFTHTARLIGLAGRDVNGGRVALTSAVGAGGEDYLAIAAVPEPASWMTMIAGFGLIGCTLRRRRAPMRVAIA